MINYNVLTKSYDNWHIEKLHTRQKELYITGMELIIDKLDEKEHQVIDYYKKILNIKFGESNFDFNKTINYLSKSRFKWKGIQSYRYCLLDELILHIAMLFPQKQKQLYVLLKSLTVNSKIIDDLKKCSDHQIDNHFFSKYEDNKLLNFWFVFDKTPRQQLGTVLILGTMSAGKSTILNNILGENWAKTQNQVSTNFSLRYKYSPTMRYEFISDNNHKIFSSTLSTADWLEELNDLDWTNNRQLTLWSGKSTDELTEYQYTVVDTPGMNSSWKTNHYYVTEQTLINFKYEKIIVVLNATQLATDDEKELLRLVKEYKGDRSVLFVLNKIDELDSELGESSEHYIQIAKKFLEENEFHSPEIVGTSAIATRLLSKDTSLLTKREQRLKSYFESYFELNSFSEQTLINERTGFSKILNFMRNE